MVLSENKVDFDSQLLSNIKDGKYDEVVTVLKKEKLFYDIVDASKSTLLHYTAENGNNRIAKYLIDSGAKVDAQDQQGKTPLMRALVNYKNVGTIQTLLKSNADIHLREEEGLSIWQMVNLNDESVIQLLIKKLTEECSGSKSIARVLIEANCPLLMAVMTKDAEVVKMMMNHGIPIIDPKSKKSAFLVAIRQLDITIVELMLRYRVDVHARDSTGFSVVIWFDYNYRNTEKHLKILKLLLDYGAYRFVEGENMMVSEILKTGNRETISMLFRYGLDCKTTYGNGSTALHYLAQNSDPSIVEEIRNKEIDLEQVDCSGYTALHLSLGAPKFLEFLLEKGANVNSTGHGRSESPLYLAYSRLNSFPQELNNISMLLVHGADPQIEHEGRTILQISTEKVEQQKAMKEIVANLVLLNALGKSITEKIVGHIQIDSFLKFWYNLFNRQIVRMKEYLVHDSVTLFKLLSASDKQFECYLRNRDLAAKFSRFQGKGIAINTDSPIYNLLRKRVKEAVEILRLKKKVAKIVFETCGFHYGTHHIIVDCIINNFSLKDLRKFD